MKYEYRVEEEDFKRVDNRGSPIRINISEARQIESLLNLGYSVAKIYEKVDFENDVSMTNLRTFIRNLKEGNIDLDGDYPAPVRMVQEMGDDVRIAELEEKLKELQVKVANHEVMFNELKDDCWASAFATEPKRKVTWRDRLERLGI